MRRGTDCCGGAGTGTTTIAQVVRNFSRHFVGKQYAYLSEPRRAGAPPVGLLPRQPSDHLFANDLRFFQVQKMPGTGDRLAPERAAEDALLARRHRRADATVLRAVQVEGRRRKRRPRGVIWAETAATVMKQGRGPTRPEGCFHLVQVFHRQSPARGGPASPQFVHAGKVAARGPPIRYAGRLEEKCVTPTPATAGRANVPRF